MCVAYNPMDSTRNLRSDTHFQSSKNENDNNLNIDPIINSRIEVDHVTEAMYVLKDLRQPTMTLATKNNSEMTVPKPIPMLMVQVGTSLGLPKPKDFIVLLDSRASGSVISSEITKKLRIVKGPKCVWNTAAGPMETNLKTKVQFMLPELSETKLIEWNMHIVNSKTMNYDIIIGRDMLEELGILIIDFKSKLITWDEISVPMRAMAEIKHDG